MKRKWMVFLAVIALVVATASLALAQRRGMHRRGDMGFGMHNLLALETRLQLTPEQSQQVRDIIQKQRTAMRQDAESRRSEHQELLNAIFSDKPDQARIDQLTREIQQRQAQRTAALVKSGLEVNQMLTSQQRAELQQVIAEKAQMREKMRERRQEFRQQRQERRMAPPQGSPQR